MCMPLEDEPAGEHDTIAVARNPSGRLPTVSETQVPPSIVPIVERLLQVSDLPHIASVAVMPKDMLLHSESRHEGCISAQMQPS